MTWWIQTGLKWSHPTGPHFHVKRVKSKLDFTSNRIATCVFESNIPLKRCHILSLSLQHWDLLKRFTIPRFWDSPSPQTQNWKVRDRKNKGETWRVLEDGYAILYPLFVMVPGTSALPSVSVRPRKCRLSTEGEKRRWEKPPRVQKDRLKKEQRWEQECVSKKSILHFKVNLH